MTMYFLLRELENDVGFIFKIETSVNKMLILKLI